MGFQVQNMETEIVGSRMSNSVCRIRCLHADAMGWVDVYTDLEYFDNYGRIYVFGADLRNHERSATFWKQTLRDIDTCAFIESLELALFEP